MHISASLIETWILLATSKDPQLKQSRDKAVRQLQELFGSIDQAISYLKNR